jgi:hypothetical protein
MQALADPTKPSESALDVVVPTDLEAPSGELSVSAQTNRFIDTYAPFVGRQRRAALPPMQRLLQTSISVVLTVFFAIGVVTGVLRVWDEIVQRRDRSPPARPVSAFGVVSGPVAEENAALRDLPSEASEPTSDQRGKPARGTLTTPPVSRASGLELVPVPDEPRKSAPVPARLRKVDAAMKEMRASMVGERADSKTFSVAVATLRAASQRDLPSKEAATVEGALEIAVRSMEISRLERAYLLYRRFAFPETSDAETIDPLD